MENKFMQMGAKRVANPITATYGVDGNEVDMEILIPINHEIGNAGQYV